eukprot:13602-Heterococcus_DN1.PRE.1
MPQLTALTELLDTYIFAVKLARCCSFVRTQQLSGRCSRAIAHGVLSAVIPATDFCALRCDFDAAVTLQNVKSWGTEGRVEGEQILPNDELFGCIVFRGMDIKDLHVHETPIEEDSHLHANNTNSLPPPPVPPAGALTATAPSPPKSPKQSQQSHQQQQQQHATTTRRAAGGRGAGGARQHQQQQQQQQGGESEGAEGGGRGHGNAPRGGRYQPPHKNPNHKASAGRGSGGRGSASGSSAPPGPATGPHAIPGMGGHLAARRVRGGVGMEVEKEEFDFQRGVSLLASDSQTVANVAGRFSGGSSS